ncbi:hypothetical protein ACFQV8_04940 [Pseudonocardia benzenivorans]
MAAVGAQTPGLAGIQPTTSAASAGGDTVPTGSRVHVLNTGGAPVNCTITTPAPRVAGSPSRTRSSPARTAPARPV